MKRTICGLLVVGMLSWTSAWSEGVSRQTALAGFAPPAAIPYPETNPYSDAKDALGRTLFFDPILSKSGTLSCSSCHQPGAGWGDGRARAIGEGHTPLALRSPTLIDVAWTDRLGWDGKFRDLESVAFAPITAPANMGMSEPEVIARLTAIPAYGPAFAAAFGDPDITRRRIELALATFERSIVARDAPFDRWAAGQENAIDAAAKRGFDLFSGKAHCAACHSGWAFTDGSFHDIGSATGADIGRGRLFPRSLTLQHAFKTPTLRDVAQRAPYMHDGAVPSLEAVIDLYDKGGIARPSLSEEIHPLGLSAAEKADLVAFLQTLTSATESAGTLPLAH